MHMLLSIVFLASVLYMLRFVFVFGTCGAFVDFCVFLEMCCFGNKMLILHQTVFFCFFGDFRVFVDFYVVVAFP